MVHVVVECPLITTGGQQLSQRITHSSLDQLNMIHPVIGKKRAKNMPLIAYTYITGFLIKYLSWPSFQLIARNHPCITFDDKGEPAYMEDPLQTGHFREFRVVVMFYFDQHAVCFISMNLVS